MISIIIPTLNEEKYLPKLLESLKKQTNSDFEVIIVDGNSADNTIEIAKDFGARIYSEPKDENGHPGRARNIGAANAYGDTLLFLDSDIVLPSNLLEVLDNKLQDPKISVGTVNYEPISKKSIDKVFTKIDNTYTNVAAKFFPRAGGWFIFCRKDLYEQVKGFDESLVMGEDHDYVRRCAEFGQFKVIKEVKVKQSYRRYDEEGRVKLAIKYFVSDMIMNLGGKVKKNPFNYEFGKHK